MTMLLMGCASGSPKTIVSDTFCTQSKPFIIQPNEYQILVKNKKELHSLVLQIWQYNLKYEQLCKNNNKR